MIKPQYTVLYHKIRLKKITIVYLPAFFNNTQMGKLNTNAYYLLTLICIIYIFDYADRHVMSSLLPFIKQEWHIKDVDLGLLTSIVSLSIGIFSIPLSILVDRWSRKKMISLMVFVWSVATLMCAFAESYTQLLIFRCLTGLGEAAYASAAVAMISRVFPKEHRSKHIGIYNAAAPLGAGLGMFVGGYIGMLYGWRHAFGLVAAPGIILAILFLYVNDYKTVPINGNKDEESILETLKSTYYSIIDLLKIKTLWYIYLAYALIIGVNTSMLSWVPSYFIRFLGFDPKEAGSIAGAMAAMILVGAPLGGYISDKWSKKNENAKLIVAAGSTIISSVALLAGFMTNNTALALTFFFTFGILTVAYLAPATSIIQEVVSPGVRAVAFGFNVMLMNLIGAFITPVFIGKLSDYIGLQHALMFLPILGLIATLLFIIVKKQYYKDLKANK